MVVLPASPLHKGRKEYTKTNEKNTHTEQNLSLSLEALFSPTSLSLKGPPLLCVCAFVWTHKQKREKKRKIVIN